MPIYPFTSLTWLSTIMDQNTPKICPELLFEEILHGQWHTEHFPTKWRAMKRLQLQESSFKNKNYHIVSGLIIRNSPALRYFYPHSMTGFTFYALDHKSYSAKQRCHPSFPSLRHSKDLSTTICQVLFQITFLRLPNRKSMTSISQKSVP